MIIIIVIVIKTIVSVIECVWLCVCVCVCVVVVVVVVAAVVVVVEVAVSLAGADQAGFVSGRGEDVFWSAEPARGAAEEDIFLLPSAAARATS
mmetsp:Transcript_24755/g.48707  ORF Transcript_24755/g.48707 Transcript_24755/m.48707 type:complete len:93 (-) Transcript_24755:38-316(-)